MAIKGKTFDLQTITAKDDGALYRILSGESDMIVFSGSGTALSINSNILTIAECYLLIGGRYIHIEAGSTIDLGTIPNSSNRGRVILKIDTSLGATQVTLEQVVTEIETIASGGSYRALVKNDINSDNGGSVYEIEFATFSCSSGVASSPALTTSVPTQSIIQTLQDDIETLADNLEQTGEAVGDLQTDVTALKNLGLSVPIPVAKGGTGATAVGNAFVNIAGMNYSSATDFNNIRLPGMYSINPSTTSGNHPTGANDYGQLLVFCSNQAYTGDYAMTLQIFTKLFGDGVYVRSFANQSWRPWHKIKNDIPDIVQFYIDKSSYSHFGYANLQITTRTNISGDTSFTSANTDYWNIQLNPGIYRMNLYCSFQSSSAVATDVGIGLGNNANRRATPIEARVQTTGSITKLNASGILKVTSYNDLYSFLIYMGDTTARDIGGYWTIERIGQ